jgi:hypothetical protein
MTEKEILEQIERLLNKETDDLRSSVRKVERLLYDAANTSINSLDIGFDAQGRSVLTNNAANMRKATAVSKSMTDAFNQVKPSLFKRIFQTFSRILSFTGLLKVAQGSPVDDFINKSAAEILFIRYGFDQKTGEIRRGSYFDSILDINPVVNKTLNDMFKSMQSGQSLNDFRNLFAQNFLTNTTGGYLTQYFDRWTQDIYMQVNATANLQYAIELGQDHAIYAGTAKDNTRCFCKERMNNIYTKEEMIGWNRLNWAGKIQGGNVLIDRGGYRCRHILNWMSKETAEITAQRRNKVINDYNRDVC